MWDVGSSLNRGGEFGEEKTLLPQPSTLNPNPSVSILLTCYNHIRHLPIAVEGIRAQTFQDFEIIAIDDGSTDGTREWLNDQADIHKVFNEANIGTYATLNVGLALAKGEFVAILNDDDVWLPKKLESQLKLLAENPEVGVVHTDGDFIDGDGKIIGGTPLGFPYPTLTTGPNLANLIYHNKIITSAALVRRESFEKVGQFNTSYFGSGDWEMWLRIAEHYDIGFVSEKLTQYRIHQANASHQTERIYRDDMKVREWIDAQDFQGVQKAMAHNAACLGTLYKLNGDPSRARKMYLKSIRLNPGRFKSYLRWLTTFLPENLFRRSVY